MTARYALIGASGFLGTNLLFELLRARREVVAISRHPTETQRLIDQAGFADLHVEAADVRDTEAIAAIVVRAGADVIIHCAAATPVGDAAERTAFADTVEVNVGGAISVLEAARRAGTKVLVYVSSAMVYGSRRSLRPLRENERLDPQGLYAITKRAAELLWLRHAELHGLDARIVRVSAAFGPYELPTPSRPVTSPIARWCTTALDGRPIREASDLPRDFTYVGDTVAGIVAVGQAPTTRHRVYNAAGGRLVWYSEALAVLAGPVSGLDYQVGPRLTRGDSTRPMRGPLLIGRLTSEFAWRPKIALDEGLRRYLAWLAGQR